MNIRQVTTTQAVIMLGLMVLIGVVCWRTDSADPLAWLFISAFVILERD